MLIPEQNIVREPFLLMSIGVGRDTSKLYAVLENLLDKYPTQLS